MKKTVYRIYVKKEAEYVIEADSQEQACMIADEWLNERSFDDCSITEEEEDDDWEFED